MTLSQPFHGAHTSHQGEVSGGELVPSRVDARPPFETAKAVLNAVTCTVEPPIHRALPISLPLPWEAMLQTTARESAAKLVVIVCPIGHNGEPFALYHGCVDQIQEIMSLVSLPANKNERNGTSTEICHGHELAVPASFGLAHRLKHATTRRIGACLADFDVRTVDKAGHSSGSSDKAKEFRPESDAVELPMPPIDRAPGTELIEIAPRAADPQAVEVSIKQRVERQGRPAAAAQSYGTTNFKSRDFTLGHHGKRTVIMDVC